MGLQRIFPVVLLNESVLPVARILEVLSLTLPLLFLDPQESWVGQKAANSNILNRYNALIDERSPDCMLWSISRRGHNLLD